MDHQFSLEAAIEDGTWQASMSVQNLLEKILVLKIEMNKNVSDRVSPPNISCI